MSSFDARLRLPGQSRLPVGVEVDVTSDRVTVSSGGRTVAAWARSKLAVEPHADGFHITVDGEEVILNVTDAARFAAALGVPQLVKKRVAIIGGRRLAGAPVAAAQTQPAPAELEDNGAPVPPVTAETTDPDAVEDYAGHIAEVAAALKSDSLSAAQAFGKWVRLLKELNHRHGQGSMSCDKFFLLNTEVLDLIPEPKPGSGAN